MSNRQLSYDELYEGHIPTSRLQKVALAVGSAAMSLYNPARDGNSIKDFMHRYLLIIIFKVYLPEHMIYYIEFKEYYAFNLFDARIYSIYITKNIVKHHVIIYYTIEYSNSVTNLHFKI